MVAVLSCLLWVLLLVSTIRTVPTQDGRHPLLEPVPGHRHGPGNRSTVDRGTHETAGSKLRLCGAEGPETNTPLDFTAILISIDPGKWVPVSSPTEAEIPKLLKTKLFARS